MISHGRFLSLVLRHRPDIIGVTLSSDGWVVVSDLITKLNECGKTINFKTLKLMVENNNKKRFEFSNDNKRIRASQGHSLNVDLKYDAIEPPEYLYHGTSKDFVNSIHDHGILKKERHHVHLSLDELTANKVGERHGVPVVLKIRSGLMFSSGYDFYHTPNNVWLTNYVPPEFIERIN